MKKTIITLLAFAAMSSQAVTFTWKSSAQVSFGDSLVSAQNPATYTATLLYLGAGSLGDVTITDAGYTLAQNVSSTGDSTTSISGQTGVKARQNSTFSGSFKQAVAGGVYGAFLTYTDAAGGTWYNFSETIYTVPSSATDITTGLSQSFDFVATKTEVASGTKVQGGSGWVRATPVPEPSVALMGLLGLGMLIKRRRA